MKATILITLLICLGFNFAQVESGVLDGVYVQEHIPTRGRPIQNYPIYVEELQDTLLNIEWTDLVMDSLEFRYAHSTYGVITKKIELKISVNDALVTELINSGYFFCSHRYLHTGILANFSDKIQIFQENQLVFSISYYNFTIDVRVKGNVLFDKLLSRMEELRAIAPELEEPFYPNFSTD